MLLYLNLVIRRSQMLTGFARFILIASSFCPVFIIFGVIDYLNINNTSTVVTQNINNTSTVVPPKNFTVPIICFAIAILLFVSCLIILRQAKKGISDSTFKITKFSRRDTGMLSFVFVYLFPLIRMSPSLSIAQYIMHAVVYVIIILIMVDVGNYQYNPVIRFFCGYRFYMVVDCDGLDRLLLSKRKLTITDYTISAKQIIDDVYIEC